MQSLTNLVNILVLVKGSKEVNISASVTNFTCLAQTLIYPGILGLGFIQFCLFDVLICCKCTIQIKILVLQSLP